MREDCLPPEQSPVFTVTVSGPERHDGEAGYTYVLHAADAAEARRLAMDYHAASQELRDVARHTDTGLTWEPDATVRPDLVFVSDQSFPGEPGWPADERGRAWHDLREPAARAHMHKAIDAEALWLSIARAIGIDVPAVNYDATDTPPYAAWAVAQMRARRALAPAGLQPQEEDVTAFICPLSHIQALTTAIDDRDLAPGSAPRRSARCSSMRTTAP